MLFRSGTDLPLAPVCDLRLHYPTHKLLAATYGRSMYTYDLNILTSVTAPSYDSPFAVYIIQNPVHDALSLKIYAENSVTAFISIYNTEGKDMIRDSPVKLEHGNNYSSLDLRNKSIADGSYLIKISCGDKTAVRKICLQKI